VRSVDHDWSHWASNYCLTSNEQFSAISWKEQVTFDEMMIMMSTYY
jgi:hypothetical protein